MKFKSGVFLLLLLLVTSCAPKINSPFDIQETGAWGPIVLKTNKAFSSYYLTQENNHDIKIEVKTKRNNDQLLIYPITPLRIGETYQLINFGNSAPYVEDIRVREPCLVYQSDPGEKSEIWKKCPGQEPVQLSKTEGKVQDFTVSQSGEWIFFIAANEFDGTNIWMINSDGMEINKIFDCSDSTCSDLDFSPMIDSLAFIQTNSKPQVKILDLNSGYVNNIQRSGSDLSFSPDGKYLSFLEDLSNQLTITNLSDMKNIYLPSSAGLVGDWAKDSQSLLYGVLDYWGGIPGVKVFELNIESGESKLLFENQNQELEFYQPSFTGDSGIYLVSVRQRSAGPSKQLWLLNESGEGIKQITNDPLYHYSFPGWNSDFSELVFQRYPINKSDGAPQIIVWKRSSDTFQIIAENAAKPFWLP
ncbi:MAG: hypothetical protein MUO42_07360 [Anaerolineaceae bacterium]|nr:hypothetical protein [Anaerolineaceae bacterium]